MAQTCQEPQAAVLGGFDAPSSDYALVVAGVRCVVDVGVVCWVGWVGVGASGLGCAEDVVQVVSIGFL